MVSRAISAYSLSPSGTWEAPGMIAIKFSRNFIGGYGFGIRAIIPFVNMVRFDLVWGESGVGVSVNVGIMEKAEMQRRRVR